MALLERSSCPLSSLRGRKASAGVGPFDGASFGLLFCGREEVAAISGCRPLAAALPPSWESRAGWGGRGLKAEEREAAELRAGRMSALRGTGLTPGQGRQVTAT